MMVMLQRFWMQITSDRKRFGVLCAAVGVGLLLWARLIVVSKMPRTAIAEPDPSISSAATSAPAPGDRPGAAADNTKREVVTLTIAPSEARDPFLINRTLFPKPTSHPAAAQEPSKSNAEPVESPEQAEARRMAQVMAHVERMRLEAVMTGQGMAVINGTLFRLNDMVPSIDNPNLTFTLIEVRSRSIVLEHQGKSFELAIPTPTGRP